VIRFDLIGRCWNWKSALLSAAMRSLIFLGVNLPVGVPAGLRSMATEFGFRTVASGLLGNLTERCARLPLSRPHAIAAIAGIAAIGHLAEFCVHWVAGTPRLAASIAASVAFTFVTTAFNLYVMRRGTLISGPGGHSLRTDLRRLPRLVLEFIQSLLWTVRRCI
jgi:hypothetical protein